MECLVVHRAFFYSVRLNFYLL